MGQVKFTIYGEPKAKGRPRFVRATGHAITPKDTVEYENLVRLEYLHQCKGHRFPDGTQLEMQVTAYYSIPKSASKRKRDMMLNHDLRPTKKPDSSNVLKAIEDALNTIAYKDDAQIVETRVSRYYGEQPKVEVIIKEA